MTDVEVGQALDIPGVRKIQPVTMVYVGKEPGWKGETALVKDMGKGSCVVQFDRTDHPRAYGWWEMSLSDFAVVE